MKFKILSGILMLTFTAISNAGVQEINSVGDKRVVYHLEDTCKVTDITTELSTSAVYYIPG